MGLDWVWPRIDIKSIKTRFAIISDGRVYSQRHILTTSWGRFHKQTESVPPFPLPSICPPTGNCLLSCRYCQVSSSIVSIGKKGLMATPRGTPDHVTLASFTPPFTPQSPDTLLPLKWLKLGSCQLRLAGQHWAHLNKAAPSVAKL